jgi:hypothetical protein
VKSDIAPTTRPDPLTAWPVDDLLRVYRRNHPDRDVTWAPCSQGCGRGARGGGTCGDCAFAELARRFGREEARKLCKAKGVGNV